MHSVLGTLSSEYGAHQAPPSNAKSWNTEDYFLTPISLPLNLIRLRSALTFTDVFIMLIILNGRQTEEVSELTHIP